MTFDQWILVKYHGTFKIFRTIQIETASLLSEHH